MERDIIGIDVTIQYRNGTTEKGHLSPGGVHIMRAEENPKLRRTLTMMRESVEGLFRPWGSKSDDGTREG